MNALIIAYWHDPRFKKKPGGLIRMFELANKLCDFRYNVTMLIPKLGFPESQTRARVIAIPFLDLTLLRPLSFHTIASIRMFRLCLKDIDLVYCRQMNSFIPLVIAKLFGITSYYEIPNDPYLVSPAKYRYAHILISVINTVCMKLCDKIVVLSEWSKKRIVSLSGISPSKIIVFPSGTDTRLFRPMEKSSACRKLGFDANKNYIGFIGSFHKFQGIDTLIDAAHLILEKNSNTQFILLGDGPMRYYWERKIQSDGLQSHFIFTGHISYNFVPNYIGVMDICVAPHHRGTNQSSPVKLFDYMSAGRPIVASNIEVVCEILSDSGCAILTEPQNPKDLASGILDLLENVTKRQLMGIKGRQYAVMNYDRKLLVKHLFL